MIKKMIGRFNTFIKYKELFYELVTRDIKLKYRRSVLGYLWSVLNPLLIMGVKILVFSHIFSRGVPNFPIYLIIGHLLFNFMTSATSRSLNSVIGNAGLLKKIYVPKYIFTFATVTSELVTFIFSLFALLIVIIGYGIPFSWKFFLIIIPIVLTYIFSLGLSLFLAQATVFFRDIVHIWSVVTTAWMFLSAIFYPINILPEKVHYFVTNYNPMYFYITMFRNFIIGVTHDPGMMDLILRGSIAAGISIIIGLISFARAKNKFILYI